MIIYKVTNTVNGKIYIGLTTQKLRARKSDHKKKMENSTYNTVFAAALRKYGWSKFKWEIIDEANDIKELLKKEIKWINHYRSFVNFVDANGYNMTLGGEGTWGKIHDENTKRKIADTKHKEIRPFLVFDTDGNFINRYNYQFECKDELKIRAGELFSLLTQRYSKHSAQGYIAIYEDEYSDELLQGKILKSQYISKDKIIEIKKMLMSGMKRSDIAKKVNVKHSVVSGIAKGNYSDVLVEGFLPKILSKDEQREVVGKLTEADVIEIKKLLMKRALLVKDIAIQFNVTENTITDINRGKTWSNVQVEGFQYFKMNHKLTEADVVEIKKMIMSNYDRKAIAGKFGITRQHVTDIKTGRMWADVEVEGFIPQPSTVKKKNLTEAEVRQIKQMLKEGILQKTIAEKFGVGKTAISDIAVGRSWSHIN